jgi:hypothetical protein
MLLYKGASLPLRIPQLEANYADGFGGGVGGPDGRGAQVSGGGGDSRRRASEGVGHPVPQRPHPQRRLPPTVRAAPTINPSPSSPSFRFVYVEDRKLGLRLAIGRASNS